MVNGHGPETSYEERAERQLQVVYARQTRERQIFMQDLRDLRRRHEKNVLKTVKKLIGPIWLQALSVPQRNALDTLEFSIYQDLLEGIPVRTANVMRLLGLYPRPKTDDLMSCIYLGRKDPKEMLAQLFLLTYGHPIESKRSSYCLNARLMLSGILYLGLNNLLKLLKIKFRPEAVDKPKETKPKRKPPEQLKSPYLQDMIAVLYLPPKRKPFQPAPLPNLDDLNEPYEEDPPVPKPPPPPPPPPPPKKRLPRSYCDKLAGFMKIEPDTSVSAVAVKTVTHRSQIHKSRGSKMCVEVKKTYGISMAPPSKGKRRKKLVSPKTGLWNAQYMINGVYRIHGKTVYVLGNVSILPPHGDLINGGYRLIDGEYINIHCGFRGRPPPPKPDPCDCLKKWQDTAFKYVKETKCTCGHYYDYGNEGTFPLSELPYFQKPTKFAPFKFNYETIYNMDQKHLYVQKEFKRIWETDSALCVGDSAALEKTNKKKKKAKRSSVTCLGDNPKPEDYLKCALRHMRRINIAAKLPDIHLVPELREWMRWRIYGPYSRFEKEEILRRSIAYWQTFLTLAKKGFGHVAPKKDTRFAGHTNWVYKQELNDKFRKFAQQYKLELFRSYAYITNLLWPTMCQAQFPDKKFREIYFSYLFSRIEEVQLMHPYSSREAIERKLVIGKRRYTCLPDGIEPEE
ncbi:uncharacterized protein LOC116766126 [Danaus plexippus]|uniref:uncharacterized protein LOC116766126 n=1 Tax=Danaus plexippus TaxID=13037 RepID=UPI002AB1EF6A|nr:uncharacterized protein LOC116766126 [Danaus plexippus]